ncbi:hypothetical protein [Clostridium sp. YIM B02555]|uniref:hypothetical protein n=1 Tax=Clostridium sp. YIM B02555 TaxID=2911968 RepID=UPI001EED7712|nr:hypothetical protein [Clostridium sp. YIM B02555]
MILSKKYKQELDKIVMSEDMKQRILNNVLNNNIEAKGIIPTVVKPIKFKRNMQLAAACFTVVICLSVVKSHPELFKPETSNIKQNQEISNNEENKISSNNEENKTINNSKVRDTDDNKNHTYDSGLDSTSDNAGSGKHENLKTDISRNADDKKGTTVKNENSNNNNLDKKENQVPIEKKDKNPNVSQVNSSIAPNTNKEPQTNEAAPTEKANEPVVTSSAPQTNENGKEANNESLEDSSKEAADNENKEKNMKRESDDESDSAPKFMISTFSSKEYKTIEEAEAAAKLQIKPIDTLPKGFNKDNISVIADTTIQVGYSNGQDFITFRAGKGSENISGDYNEYTIKKTTKINGIDVNLNGNKDKLYNLATWKKEGISYSISSTNDINENEIENMVKSSLNK